MVSILKSSIKKTTLYDDFWKDYYNTMQRKGVTVEYAQREASSFNLNRRIAS